MPRLKLLRLNSQQCGDELPQSCPGGSNITMCICSPDKTGFKECGKDCDRPLCDIKGPENPDWCIHVYVGGKVIDKLLVECKCCLKFGSGTLKEPERFYSREIQPKEHFSQLCQTGKKILAIGFRGGKSQRIPQALINSLKEKAEKGGWTVKLCDEVDRDYCGVCSWCS